MDHIEVPLRSARGKSQVPVVGYTPDPNHISHHQLVPEDLGAETGIKAVVLFFGAVRMNQSR